MTLEEINQLQADLEKQLAEVNARIESTQKLIETVKELQTAQAKEEKLSSDFEAGKLPKKEEAFLIKEEGDSYHIDEDKIKAKRFDALVKKGARIEIPYRDGSIRFSPTEKSIFISDDTDRNNLPAFYTTRGKRYFTKIARLLFHNDELNNLSFTNIRNIIKNNGMEGRTYCRMD